MAICLLFWGHDYSCEVKLDWLALNIPVNSHVYKAFDSRIVEHFFLNGIGVEHGIELELAALGFALNDQARSVTGYDFLACLLLLVLIDRPNAYDDSDTVLLAKLVTQRLVTISKRNEKKEEFIREHLASRANITFKIVLWIEWYVRCVCVFTLRKVAGRTNKKRTHDWKRSYSYRIYGLWKLISEYKKGFAINSHEEISELKKKGSLKWTNIKIKIM